MSFWNFTRGPASVRLMLDLAQERGLDMVPLLAGSGLSVAQLDDPHAEVSAAQELRVVRNLLRRAKGATGLGLQAGLRYNFSSYGMWGYGLISSATARDALSLALRFIPLTYAFTLIQYHEEGDQGVLTFGEPDLDPALMPFLVERDMVGALVLMRDVVGPGFVLSQFSLRSPSPSSPQAIEAIHAAAGVRLTWGARRNSIVFDKAQLDRPLPQANPLTVSMCEQMCRQLIEQRRARVGTANMIRQYLSAAPLGIPSLSQVAQWTHSSPRTLKRRLKEEGTSFRALVVDSRGQLAKDLLLDAHLSVSEVAERMGFSDLSSFSQAFKRWHGMAPSAFRRGT